MSVNTQLTDAWKLPEADRRNALVSIIRTALQDMQIRMQNILEDHKNAGLEAMYAHADALDILLREITFFVSETVFAAQEGTTPTLVAVGGYGRRELAPYSDIDILFLLHETDDNRQREIVSYLLYLLWDCGLKVGQSARTPSECIIEAEKDMSIRTNLLEARFICGDWLLYHDFHTRYEELRTRTDGQDFFDAKQAEQKERYLRMGQSRYMLEPNIKESRGGLRDLHLLFWLSKYLFGITDIRDLAERQILSSKEISQFLKAHRFLSTIRCHLHFLTKRDILTFDAQKEIAVKMGYVNRINNSAVERFMKHYYLISKTVGELTGLITAVIKDSLIGFISFKMLEEYPGFYLINDRLSFKEDVSLEEDPLLMLKAFDIRQKTGFPLNPKLVQTVTEKSKLIRRIRKSKEAHNIFSDILLSETSETALRLMSETGILGYLIPAWQKIVAQMQFDLYHIYTTDEHTFKAIGYLSEFENIQSKRALYFAVLLHDIAKGRGGSHAEKGEEIARKTAIDLGLDEEEVETVAWLVRQHLLMSQTAFRRDIFDPKTIDGFVAVVQSPERLRLLYAVTKADIKAVGPEVWNSFKEKLLNDLFTLALERIQGNDLKPREMSDVQKRFASMPKSEEISFSVRTDETHGATEFIVFASDRDGLFAEITGAMALADVSVAEAQIMTLPNGMALDTFLIQETDMLDKEKRKPVESQKKLKRIQEIIRKARLMDIDEELKHKRRKTPQNTMWFPPRVIVDNGASDTSTLIEVNGNDAVGFLHEVTHTMTLLDLKIVSAHIYTYGSHVVDVFYVTNKKNKKVENTEHIEQIKTVLLDTLNGNTSVLD